MLAVLTALTLIAFAANSLLCRTALGWNLIDPVSFTTLRLASGAIGLILISQLVSEKPDEDEIQGSWGSGIALFAYALPFSLAYVSLSTGLGALILFGAVQATMISAGLRSGETLGVAQWAGMIAAIIGLIYLLLPGSTAPNLIGAILMGVAGIAWGVYSLRGKGASTPARITAANFLRAVPIVLIASVIAFRSAHLEFLGISLALVSGVVTSGLGYVLWYKVMRRLTTTQAAVVQLLVPVLAAFGGVVFLSEQLSFKLLSASVLILGGVATVVLQRPIE
jgi:drug/metabolite transporter (DMT)-like permease